MDQNLWNYRIFYIVAQKKNISHAAKELFISQPAISKAISKLEDNLNATLFHRSSRGVSLTEEGELLYNALHTAFVSIKQGEDSLKKMNQLNMGTLKIGVSTTLCKYILLPYLKEFIHHYPHIKIMIECQSSRKTMELLDKGAIDIGFVGKPEDPSNIPFHFILHIEDIFVASPMYLEHLFFRESENTTRLTTSDGLLERGDLMVLDEKNLSRIYIDKYLMDNNIITNSILEVSNMDLLIEFAKSGLGISCVIKEFVQKELDNLELKELTLSPPMEKRPVGFIYNPSSHTNTALKKFLEFYQI